MSWVSFLENWNKLKIKTKNTVNNWTTYFSDAKIWNEKLCSSSSIKATIQRNIAKY